MTGQHPCFNSTAFREKFSPYFLFHTDSLHFIHRASTRSGGWRSSRWPPNRLIRSAARRSSRGRIPFLPAAPAAQQRVRQDCWLAHDGDKGDLTAFPPLGEPAAAFGHILVDTHSRQNRHAEGAPRAEASALNTPGAAACRLSIRPGSGNRQSKAAALTGPMPGTDIRMR